MPHSVRFVLLRYLRHLYEGQFRQQAFVAALAIVDVALIEYLQCRIEKLRCAPLCLFGVAVALRLACLYELGCGWCLRHQYVAHVGGKAVDHPSGIEAVG